LGDEALGKVREGRAASVIFTGASRVPVCKAAPCKSSRVTVDSC
jgi:hypothetical protein